jgi:hypothetical protein
MCTRYHAGRSKKLQASTKTHHSYGGGEAEAEQVCSSYCDGNNGEVDNGS